MGLLLFIMSVYFDWESLLFLLWSKLYQLRTLGMFESKFKENLIESFESQLHIKRCLSNNS